MKGPSKSYADLCDEVLVAREKGKKFGSPLRPSNAGTCARRMAYEYADYKDGTTLMQEERRPSVLRLLSLGHYIEEQAIEELKGIEGMSVRFGQQLVDFFELSDGTRIEGSTDAVMWSDATRGVLDVKSVGDRWEAAYNSKWDKFIWQYGKMASAKQFGDAAFWVEDLPAFLNELGTDDSLYKNLVQVNGYACTEFLQKRGVDHGSILRYNKNNSRLMEVRFAPSMEVFKQVQDKMQGVVDAYNSGDLATAPKERVLGSLDCAYCPARGECWPAAGKRDFYKNKPKVWGKRMAELNHGKEVAELFTKRAQLEESVASLEEIDRDIILLLEKEGVQKVTLDNKEVFEVAYLKDKVKLKRSK